MVLHHVGASESLIGDAADPDSGPARSRLLVGLGGLVLCALVRVSTERKARPC